MAGLKGNAQDVFCKNDAACFRVGNYNRCSNLLFSDPYH